MRTGAGAGARQAVRRSLLMFSRGKLESLLLLKAGAEPLSANPVRLNAGPMRASNALSVKAEFPLKRTGATTGMMRYLHQSLRLTGLDGI
jgi:hypothetical protein